MTEQNKTHYEVDPKTAALGNKIQELENRLDATYGTPEYAELQKQYATAVGAYYAAMNYRF